MTVYCSATGCQNCCRKEDRWKGKTFFRFPLKNKVLNDQWVNQIGRKDFVPNASSRLCSDHFEDECFTYQPFTNRRQLKPGSLPTKFDIMSEEPKARKFRRNKFRENRSSRLEFTGDSHTRESSEEGVLMAAHNHSSADIASSSTSETQELNDSSDDSQGKLYIIRCNPQNGVVVKQIETDGTETLVPSYAESSQELSDQNIPCRKRKACEICDEAAERRHREKMQKWDMFLNLMEELVETCKSKNSDKPNLGQKMSADESWPAIAEKLKQFVGLITVGKQSAYVKFELVD